MSSSEDNYPVVLFIDDIQWMDEGSRQLIEMFVTDEELTNVLLVLAYRDEEANKIQDVITSKEGSIDIQLSNLDYAGVHEMVCGFLGSSEEARFRELTDLVMTKTQGHPYFALQFLHTIVEEGLLTKSEDGSWNFDVQTINREITVSNTLADLLHRKIDQLFSVMKTILTVASLFGYCFDGSMLIQVVSQEVEHEHGNINGHSTGSPAATVKICLAEAVEAGFIERLDECSYQFSLDKLQAAFLQFVDDVEREKLQFQIGGAFLAQQEGGDGSMAFNAAVHLNEAISYLHSNAQRVTLARLNLKAAQHCAEMIAFNKACGLLCTGLELLDSGTKWSADLFDLTFEMTEELAHLELSAGRFDDCKEHVEELLRHAKSTEMKINALMLGSRCRMASNDVDDALLAAKRALRILNVVKVPNKISLMRHVLPKLLSIERKMSRMTDEGILGLPIMQDRRFVAATTRLLADILLYCLAKDDDDQAAYAALLAMELTLQYGLSPYSSTALALFGISELQFGNYDRAYRYGKLAMKLMDESACGDGECSTVVLATTILLHWKEPLSDLKVPLYRATHRGLERGDFVYGAFCFWQYTVMDTSLGKNLDEVAASYAIQYRRSCALGGASAFQHWIQPSIQFVANLQSESVNWEQLTILTGEYMQEDIYVQEAKEANHTTLYTAALWSKAQLACFFGLYDLAEAKYKQIAGMGALVHLSFAAVAWYEFAAIMHYEQYKLSGRRARLRKARRCKRKLIRMQSLGCPNVATSLLMIEVKEISIRKGVDETVLAVAFDNAITALSGTSYLEAIANEDAGFTFARLGLRARAENTFSVPFTFTTMIGALRQSITGWKRRLYLKGLSVD